MQNSQTVYTRMPGVTSSTYSASYSLKWIRSSSGVPLSDVPCALAWSKCHKNAGLLEVSLNEICAAMALFLCLSRFVYCIYLNDIIYIIKGGANDESKQRKYRWIS